MGDGRYETGQGAQGTALGGRPLVGRCAGGLLLVYDGELIAGGRFTTAGDLNCDGVVSFDDINPFVLALSNWTEWRYTYTGCPERNADINGDGVYGGVYGFGDINPFVELLAGSGGQPIPCP